MVFKALTGARGETRVNLKHLLEDIRDSYSLPLAETIIVELIANALDSRTGDIRLYTDPVNGTLTIIDDGKGMNQEEFKQYHDIAATTKTRGKGIGFAGVGAKLSLLMGKVTTETKAGKYHSASEWWLESAQRAPWREIATKDRVPAKSGTSVSIACRSHQILSDNNFVRETVRRHFYSLIEPEFGMVLNDVYTRPIKFYINDELLVNKVLFSGERKTYLVKRGRRQKPIGYGFIVKSTEELPEEYRGIAISTYGKVIKRGWDWLGITPHNPSIITGIVEIPELSEILTTNKADFLRDAASLKKYYTFRKTVQDALEPILRSFGEVPEANDRQAAAVRPLEKEIAQVLKNMMTDFPELSPLLGRKADAGKAAGIIPDENAEPVGITVEGGDLTGAERETGEGGSNPHEQVDNPAPQIQPDTLVRERGKEHEARHKSPAIMIGYEDQPHVPELGWLRESTIWINKGHPAHKKIGQGSGDRYYTHFVVAWVLSSLLEEGKSPLDFINQYLMIWGKGNR